MIIAKQAEGKDFLEESVDDRSVFDNPLRFGCWPQIKPEGKDKRNNDTTFSLPVIQDDSHGMIRLKQGNT